jgi:hypothetical protein
MTRPVVNRDLLGSPGERNLDSPSLAYGSTDLGAHGWFHAGGDGGGGDGGGEETGTDGDGAHCGVTVGYSPDIQGRFGAGVGCDTGGADAGIATGAAEP